MTTCIKCNEPTLTLFSEEYLGEHTKATYICTECQTKTTNYYDSIFNFFIPLPTKVSQEELT
jgi:protein-arginine kinase activator protein McsA